MEEGAGDRFAIEQQIYKYAYSWDSGDVDGFLSVFTDDLIGDGVMVGQTELFSHIEGADAMRTFFEGGHGDGAPQVLHHTSTIVFEELNEDSAWTRAMVIVTTQSDKGPVIATHGVYHDRWRKTPDGWRIERRLYEAHGYRRPPAAVGDERPTADVGGNR